MGRSGEGYRDDFSSSLLQTVMTAPKPFNRNRDFYLLTRTPGEITAKAETMGLPKDTWGIASWDGPVDWIMLPPPPEPQPIRRGWKWAMYRRDLTNWAHKFSHEYRHLTEGHHHV